MSFTHLKPRSFDSIYKINMRGHWKNESDCLNCNVDFERPDPENVSAFNEWAEGEEELYLFRRDEAGSLM